ncbi:hypothetical protein EDF46_1941 [Frondihabitans sp. PhB188]|nr:hypothetical protein EDF46_1941 [Frondihabitans sp. PhB188]
MTVYFRRVAFELRLRGVPEATIRNELDRLSSANSGGDLEAVLGPPQDVASAFGGERRTGMSKNLVWIGGGVLVLAVLVQIAGFGFLHQDLRAGPFPLFSVALPVFGLLFAASVAVDHRLPRGFTRANPDGQLT